MKEYLPDSIYLTCGSSEECGVCKNEIFSNNLNGMVHDPLIGKVFCPFGMGETMNKNTFSDQMSLYSTQSPSWGKTTWGHVPQLDPRSLMKLGLSWRN